MAISSTLLGMGGLAMSGFNLLSEIANRRKMLKLQETAWEREDTAVARRVADLKAAGMNPVLAAGSSAQASGPIRTEAPQIGGKGMEAMLAVAQLGQLKANTAKTNAEVGHIEELTKALDVQNRFSEETYQSRVDYVTHNTDVRRLDALIRGSDQQIRSIDRMLAEHGFQASVSEQALRELEAEIRMAWRIQRDSFAWTDPFSNKVITVDLSKVSLPEQLDLIARELYVAAARKQLTLLGKDVEWYGVKAIANTARSAAGTVYPFVR